MLMSQRDRKETYATRYFISRLAMDMKRIAHAVRCHWNIENTCHWCLEITYREDESRIREARLPGTVAVKVVELQPGDAAFYAFGIGDLVVIQRHGTILGQRAAV